MSASPPPGGDTDKSDDPGKAVDDRLPETLDALVSAATDLVRQERDLAGSFSTRALGLVTLVFAMLAGIVAKMDALLAQDLRTQPRRLVEVALGVGMVLLLSAALVVIQGVLRPTNYGTPTPLSAQREARRASRVGPHTA